MELSVDAKNAALQGIADRLNVGNNSVLSIYVGLTLAAEITLLNPVQTSIADAVMTFKIPPKVLAIASGVPTAAKILAADGTLEATLDAATELTLDKDKIYQGGYVTLTALTMGI
ncbi:hypothetical protein [Psychrobacter sp. DAB_AL43B]|uniref:hypothetical protein n=1 Tax=Psychrobacter sp. DAB_AL43B TaxID=1028416 RepID=UPI0009A6847D|nr:hypothetical protein [Psychrobacter sp. DAB_AL43B]SLJ84498.1 hypothetical protein DABAL43B_1302 [Psychrobacter sp. DAB_AL43B]